MHGPTELSIRWVDGGPEVLAAVNALGANQREHGMRLASVEGQLSRVEVRLIVEGR